MEQILYLATKLPQVVVVVAQVQGIISMEEMVVQEVEQVLGVVMKENERQDKEVMDEMMVVMEQEVAVEQEEMEEMQVQAHHQDIQVVQEEQVLIIVLQAHQ